MFSFISKMEYMRDHILQEDRIKAIIEELSGFLLDEVIDPKGEFHDDDEPLPRPSGDQFYEGGEPTAKQPNAEATENQ